MSSRELVLGYAFLKSTASYRAIKSPLDALDALALRAVIRTPGKSLGPSALQSAIKKVWGLQVPELVCQYGLSRLATQNYVVLQEKKEKGYIEYTPTIPPQIIENMQGRETQARELISRVTEKIDRFLKNENPGTSRKGTDIIESWLDTSSIALMAENYVFQPASDEDRDANRVISKVLGVLNLIDDTFLDDLTTLAVGDAIYKSVKNLTEFESFEYEPMDVNFLPMAQVEVYLDTVLIFKALGYYGDMNHKSAHEFLGICKSTGCKIRSFEHTIEECIEGLMAVAQRLRSRTSDAYGPIVNFALEEGLDASDLITKATKLRNEVASLGIEIREKLPHVEELTVDEIEFDKRLESAVKQVNKVARQRDIDSTTSIYRQRQGQGHTHLERCLAIFVTSNRTLADSSTRFFRRVFEESGQSNSVQICMTDVIFCTRLWTKLPTAQAKLPRMQVLGHALGNLVPPENVVRKFKNILSALINNGSLKEEDAIRIEYSEFVRLSLALNVKTEEDLTLDEARNIILRSIDDLKSRFKSTVSREVEARLAEAHGSILRIREDMHRQDLDLQNIDNANLINQLEALEGQLKQKTNEVLAIKKLAKFVSACSIFIIAIIFFVGLFFIALREVGFSEVFGYKLDSMSSVVVRGVAAVAAALLTIFGLSIVDLYEPLKNLLAGKLLDSFMKAD